MTQYFKDLLSSPEFAFFVLGLLPALATTAVGAIAYFYRKYIKGELDVATIRALQEAAKIAVLYVEQTSTGQDLLRVASEKRDEAIRVAQTILTQLGVKVTAQQLWVAIEAAVYAEITRQSLPNPDSQPTQTVAGSE